MPKALEERLKRQAEREGLEPGTDRYNAYVYGTLKRIERKQDGHGNDNRKADK